MSATRARPAQVVCCGIAVQDHVFAVERLPREPGKHFATGFQAAGGGPAATASVAVARLGGSARLWARVGEDGVGRQIRDELAAYRVATDAIRVCPGAVSGQSAILVDPAGERLIVNYADPRLDRDPSWLPTASLAGADAVLADLRWPEGATAALQAATAAGIPGVLDADSTPSADADAVGAAYAAASHVLFARPALTALAGETDPGRALTAVAGRFDAWLGVTCGPEGGYWLDGGAVRHRPAHAVTAVDTAGAGDVAHGAFALALAEGRDPASAMAFAGAAAASKCTRFGARAGIPERGEVDTMLTQEA